MTARIYNDEFYKLSAIELYKMVIREDIKRFPNGFWKRPEAEQNAVEITKYLIADILVWKDADIKEKWCSNI